MVSTLAERVQQYNLLVAEYNKHLTPAAQPEVATDTAPAARRWDKAREATTLEAVRKQEFSWADEYSCESCAWDITTDSSWRSKQCHVIVRCCAVVQCSTMQHTVAMALHV